MTLRERILQAIHDWNADHLNALYPHNVQEIADRVTDAIAAHALAPEETE